MLDALPAAELGRIFDRLGELFAAKIRQLRQRQARPEPAREATALEPAARLTFDTCNE